LPTKRPHDVVAYQMLQDDIYPDLGATAWPSHPSTDAKRSRLSEVALPGWQCSTCSYCNEPTRPGCEFCTNPRPEGYQIPDGYVPSEAERARMAKEEAAIQQLKKFEEEEMRTLNEKYLKNKEEFMCEICADDIAPNEGVELRNCQHNICSECLINLVRYCEDPVVVCPHVEGTANCQEPLQEREIRALVPEDVYERYLQRSVAVAENKITNSFHCKTPDCRGWCVYEDDVNLFACPVCAHTNCLTCQAIHEGLNCKNYQEKLALDAETDPDTRKSHEFLQSMLDNNTAMRCPTCRVILMKKEGCDWLMCSMCKTEICWVTRGPRWGPKGLGDTSGGCKCRVKRKRCHPKCGNCH